MKIIECPRDAMQGIDQFIQTEKKINYLNQLLKVNFDTLDFGSFVSPKAIPQMQDTAEVVKALDLTKSKTKLLAIIANVRGAEDATQFDEISYLGFPLSISETFQVRNTNKTIIEALNALEEIQNICISKDKTLVTYISMGFGNPYNDPYSEDVVAQFAGILDSMGVKIISLADTVGAADTDLISRLFQSIIPQYPEIEFGAHLHSTPETAMKKIETAYSAGCRRFDGALKGYGGCPMADDDLVGNIPTESIINFMVENQIEMDINEEEFRESMRIAPQVFPD